jgi:tRNA 2-thiocytidine biosynthesis protein TtcA
LLVVVSRGAIALNGQNLLNFKDLHAIGVADSDGDIAFDEEPCAAPTSVISLHLDKDE